MGSTEKSIFAFRFKNNEEARRDNYRFFQSFVSSWYAVTTEIDCTEAREAARRQGRSFFLHYLYAVVRAANEVDELRYRIDKQGQVVFHDCVDIITPIAVPGRTFFTLRIPYHLTMKISVPSTMRPIGS